VVGFTIEVSWAKAAATSVEKRTKEEGAYIARATDVRYHKGRCSSTRKTQEGILSRQETEWKHFVRPDLILNLVETLSECLTRMELAIIRYSYTRVSSDVLHTTRKQGKVMVLCIAGLNRDRHKGHKSLYKDDVDGWSSDRHSIHV